MGSRDSSSVFSFFSSFVFLQVIHPRCKSLSVLVSVLSLCASFRLYLFFLPYFHILCLHRGPSILVKSRQFIMIEGEWNYQPDNQFSSRLWLESKMYLQCWFHLKFVKPCLQHLSQPSFHSIFLFVLKIKFSISNGTLVQVKKNCFTANAHRLKHIFIFVYHCYSKQTFPHILEYFVLKVELFKSKIMSMWSSVQGC